MEERGGWGGPGRKWRKQKRPGLFNSIRISGFLIGSPGTYIGSVSFFASLLAILPLCDHQLELLFDSVIIWCPCFFLGCCCCWLLSLSSHASSLARKLHSSIRSIFPPDRKPKKRSGGRKGEGRKWDGMGEREMGEREEVDDDDEEDEGEGRGGDEEEAAVKKFRKKNVSNFSLSFFFLKKEKMCFSDLAWFPLLWSITSAFASRQAKSFRNWWIVNIVPCKLATGLRMR